MKWSIANLLALVASFQPLSALPVTGDDGGLQIVATTTTPSGQVIDWVVLDSQPGTLAAPPPAPPSRNSALSNGTHPDIRALVAATPALQGPNGTVPIARPVPGANAPKKLPSSSQAARRSADVNYAGNHWYASTAQGVNNHGGIGTLSMFKAYVQSPGDFSLLQTAVIRYNVPVAAGGTTTQTVEAGWINYPNQVAAPHLFTFYTTNGYSVSGGNVGGWNRDQAGWVQYDSQVYPGFAFGQNSADGGTNYDLNIQYQLTGGNWWLWVVDRWIGYYPANLFTKNGVASGNTLETMSSQINWYGEIYNSESSLTTTDMGSGEFPSAGYGRSGYIHNIQYLDTNGNAQTYDGSAQVIVSDTSRYNINTFWNSGTSWGSYFYLGGPGAGGVVNG